MPDQVPRSKSSLKCGSTHIILHTAEDYASKDNDFYKQCDLALVQQPSENLDGISKLDCECEIMSA